MTDAGAQFAILASLSAIGAASGGALAVINFADNCIDGRPMLRFLAEFAVISEAGALVWLVVLTLSGGNFRLFFALPTTVFCVISYICISKFLSPRLSAAKKVILRFANTRIGEFLVKYILK